MTDNFDSNVARRKPKVLKPRRPWDIPAVIDEDGERTTAPAHEPHATITNNTMAVSTTPPDAVPVIATPETARANDIIVNNTSANNAAPIIIAAKPSRRSNDLSDSININSNYCKFDNDVSDHLLGKLSASAQSVYVRLYRQSFGWNRNWAAESLPKLTKACNLSLQTVRKAIRELESIGCIAKEFSDYHKATVYRVFLPSEIGMGNPRRPVAGRLNIDTQGGGDNTLPGYVYGDADETAQYPDTVSSGDEAVRNEGGQGVVSGGQIITTESIYFKGTSTYALLESGGALPKNISIYTNDIHLAGAVAAIDEFYDSIGFSVVSRSMYRKSLLDYFELIKAGFSPDDIRYAVRWTFKNSRTRPESFSLIKHTMHLAMDDLIRELRGVSGEKDQVEEKTASLKRSLEQKSPRAGSVTTDDLGRWADVAASLRETIGEHSFGAFIEPLRPVNVADTTVTLTAPRDAVSWVNDHYRARIEELYREKTGEDITVVVE